MTIDNLLTQLSGINKPEENRTIDLILKPISLVKIAFNDWSKILDEIDDGRFLSTDYIYGAAYQTLKPYEKELPKKIEHPDYFSPIGELKGHQSYGGLFYSALLNMDKVLIVPPSCPQTRFWAYDQKFGCLVYDGPETNSVGIKRSNGIIINYSSMMLFFGEQKITNVINYGALGGFYGDYLTFHYDHWPDRMYIRAKILWPYDKNHPDWPLVKRLYSLTSKENRYKIEHHLEDIKETIKQLTRNFVI